MLCALPLLASCAAADPAPPPLDDAATDKTPTDDTATDVLKTDADDVAPPEDVAPDVSIDAAPDVTVDATIDTAPDVTVDVAPDIAPVDVAPDTSCRTRCSGFCTDPETDVHNCGLCGNDCTLRAGVDGSRVTCAAGRCVFTGACLPGRANCSGNPDDGCEAVVTTAARCGSCTNTCRDPTPNCGMMAGAPGGYACTSGCVAPANQRCGSSCVNTMTDPLNCGACGTVCPSGLRGTPACAMGRCTLTCIANYGDCDGIPTNGCETIVSSNVSNCGMCGNVCPPGPGATPICSAGACTITCAAGQGNCDGNAANGCETDTRTSSMNCGACPARANGTSSCVSSACTVTCNAGFGNCNALVTDGCEASLMADPLNCGACARRCTAATNASASCAMGVCGITCLAGYGNCDGNGLNGCESTFNTDPRNCGACGNVCPTAAGATPSCAAGRCGLACATGAGDCNMNPGDGCETDITMSNTHCGACGVACNAPSDGRAQCMASRCVVTCNAGFTLSGTMCVRAAPMNVSPPSGGIVTSRRPRFTVALPSGQSGARVEICGDRACTSVASTLTLTGASGDATISLTPGTYYWRATGLIAGSPVTSAGIATEFTVSAGATATASASWGPILDVGADRYADLMVGVPSSLYAQLWTNTSGSISSSLYTTRSGSSSFGTSVSSAGDINGDGYIDAVIGAPTINSVSVYHSNGSTLAPAVTTTITAPAGVTRFGASVSSAGDVNGDGYSDVLVGAPGSNRAFLYYGTATGVNTATPVSLNPSGSASNFGVSVAGLGDVNADGYADVAVGTDGASIVYVWYGGGAGLGATPTGISAPSGANGFGRAVAGAGDVNGDGYPDAIVGAYNSATAYVFLGGATGLTTTPAATLSGGGSQFGIAVDGAGDTNGDGYGDVVVGAPGADRAYVFFGRAGGASPTPSVTITPSYTGYQFGTAVSGIGDFNNDGYTDIVVSSLNRSVQIFRGSATGPVLYATFIGSTSFGTSIAARHVSLLRPRS